MSATIKYKGSAIAELTENGTKTLKTSGKYCEADIVVENTKDGGAEITDGIVVKARDASGYITEVDHYGSEIGASQYRAQSSFAFANLTTINVKSGFVDVSVYGLAAVPFTNDTVTNLFPYIKSLRGYSMSGCKNITEINLPNCERIGKKGVGKSGDCCFKGCSNLIKLALPKLQFVNTGTNEDGVVAQIGTLRELTVGSVGYPYAPDGAGHFFYRQTSADIVATFYVENETIGNTVLTRERNGMPNGTIIIKSAITGETIVTSTP